LAVSSVLGDGIGRDVDGGVFAIGMDVEAVLGDIDADTAGVECEDHGEVPSLRM
jgi:hypothetical protein